MQRYGNSDKMRPETKAGHEYIFDFASLVDITTVDEQGLKLGDDAGRDEDEIEDGEEAELEVGNGITDLPEGETCEEGGEGVQGEFVVDIIGITEE